MGKCCIDRIWTLVLPACIPWIIIIARGETLELCAETFSDIFHVRIIVWDQYVVFCGCR
jgi:hypothetical protein